MTNLERIAIREALRTADFSRSPGLRERMLHSLRKPTNRDLHIALVLFAAGLAVWWLAIWHAMRSW